MTVKLPDGTKHSYGSALFEEQAFTAGSKVKFTKDTFKSKALWDTIISGLSKEMAESFLNNPEQSYEVIEIS